jgi:uncharacterized membrane protein YtjA (UPF0391 family)
VTSIHPARNRLFASDVDDATRGEQVQEIIMLGWAIAFLIIAIIAGLLGFGVVAGTAFLAARIVFVVALLAFLISGVVEVTRRGAP